MKSILGFFKRRSGLQLLATAAMMAFGAVAAQAQTTLSQGDVAVVAINSANPDSFAIVLLKDIASGTVINFTDNGFTAGTTGRTGEGFLTYTAPSALSAGTVLAWTNGMTITGTGWSAAAPANFSFNGSGDQFFIFQGATGNWAAQTSITLIYGINYGIALSATSGASNTVQPTALTSAFLNLPSATNANGYFANGSSAASSVTQSGTSSAVLTNLVTASKWFGTTGTAATFPSYSFTISNSTIAATGTLSAFTTTYGTAATAQTVTVSGSGLTANLVATAPTGFEVSSDGTTYGSTATFTQSGGSASGTLSVRLAATASVTGTSYNSKNIVLSSTGATSVNIVTAASGNSVTAKELTITGLSGNAKVYDGTTAATFTGTPAYSGLVNGETFSVTGTPSASFDSPNVTLPLGTVKQVFVTGYTAPSTNYTLTQPTFGSVITQKSLTVTANNLVKPYGNALSDGSSSAFTSSGLVGTETIGSVSISYTSGAGATEPGGTYTGAIVPSAATGGTFTATNYSISYVAGDLTVTSNPILNVTGSLTAVNIAYGETAATPAVFTLSGNNLMPGTITVTAPTGFEVSTNHQNGFASSLDIVLGGGILAPYSIYVRLAPTAAVGTYSGNVTASGGGAMTQTVPTVTSSVAPKNLTISGVTAVSREYDGTTNASLTGTPAYEGLVNGESFTVSGTPSASFASKTAGSSKSVTVSGYDAPSSNYTVTQPSLSADITAKALTISGAAVTTKTYDATITATITGSLSGVIGSDAVTFSGTGTFAQPAPGTGIAVASTSTLGGADAGNYTLTQPLGLTGDITKANQTITFNALSSKATTDAPFSLTATASSGLAVSYASSNTAVATVSENTVTIVGAGSTTITASQAGDGNFNAAADVTQTLTVTSGPTTLAAGDIAVIGYNTSGAPDNFAILILKDLNAGTVFYINDNEVSADGGTSFTDLGEGEASFTVKSGQTISKGTVIILPWGATAVSTTAYDYSSTSGAGLGNNNEELYIYTASSITATTPTAFLYYAKIGASTSSRPSGLTAGTTFISPTGSASRYKISGANYSDTAANLLASIGTASNWEATAPGATTDWTFSIKAPQSISFGPLTSVTFGDAPFTLSATASSGLTVTYASSNTNVATVSGNTVTIVGAGTANITASQTGDSTYGAAAPVSQPLTVNKAAQTITFDALANKTYGDTAFLPGATASSGGVVTYSSSNSAVAAVTGGSIAITGAGTVTITASQAGTANYNAATDVTQSLTVDPKALTITANDVTKVSGTALSNVAASTAFTSNGLVSPDTVGTVTINYGDGAAAGDAPGTYAASVVPSAATGGTFLASNYTISYVNGTLTVSAAPAISVSGTLAALNATYGTASGTPSSFTVSGGNLTGDLTVTAPANFEVSTSAGSGYGASLTLTATSGAVASTPVYVRLAASAAAGTYSGNVTVSGGGTSSPATVAIPSSTVATKALTITGLSGVNREYDGTTNASVTGTPEYSGLENGDTFSVTGTASATFASKTVGTAKAITVTGYTEPSGNYTVTQPTGLVADITAKALTVTGAAVTTKPFDGNTNATITGTLSGVIAPDVVTFTGTGTFAQATPGTNIAVTSTSSLGGADAANYTLTQPVGLTGTITGSANADLTNLAISPGLIIRTGFGTFGPGFINTSTAYNAFLSSSTASVTVTPTLADSNATVTVNGNSAATPVSLTEGANTITVLVTAQDTTTTKTYTLAAYRAAAALTAGSIAITGLNTDGNDDLAFAALTTIAQNSVIHFSDNEWNGSAIGSGGAFNDANESEMVWIAPAGGLAAGSIVVLNNLSTSPTANVGTVLYSNQANRGYSTTAEAVYAFQGATHTAEVFLAGITTDTAASFVNTGLTNGSTLITLASSSDAGRYKGARSGQSAFAGYLSLIGNVASNWDDIGNGDGTTYLPFSTTAFTSTANDALVSINSVSVTEGNSGTTTLNFTVTRTNTNGAFTVNYATADGTATTADNDYVANSGTLTFAAAGAATQTIDVTINGDTAPENDETFTVTLSGISNTLGTASISTATGTGTIVNDEALVPVITGQPSSQSIATGSRATLTVTATSSPAATYQWYAGTSGDTAAPISGATAASYTTPILSANASYWVRLTNTAGSTDSNTASISVAYAAPLASSNINVYDPHTNAWNTAGVTVNGSSFINLGLQGVGRVAASSIDSATGESLGSVSDLQITGWAKNSDGTYSGTFQALPDRGFNNGSIYSNYAARINSFDFTFTPYTSSSPTTAQNQIAMTFAGSTRFTYDNGSGQKYTTGLLADGTTTVFGGATAPAAAVSTTQSDGTVSSRLSLDSEGLVLDSRPGKAGAGWVSDEYGPYIYHFNASKQLDGQLQLPQALLPHKPAGTLSFVDTNVNGRRTNQGMEGISQSPDGSKLFALMQSATLQDSGSGNQGRFNTRLLVYDISSTDTPNDPTAQYVIQLPRIDTTGSTTNGTTVDRTGAQSSILALNNTQVLILARDGNGRGASGAPVFKSILLADLSTGTNIDGSYDSEAAAVAPSGTLTASVTPISWTEAVNMLATAGTAAEVAKFNLNLDTAPGDINSMCEKWEALALVSAQDVANPNDYFLFVGNDNDFITANTKYLDASGTIQTFSGNNFENDTLILAYRVRMTGFNQAPFLADAPAASQTASTGSAFSYTLPSDAFVDPNGDSLTYSATLADGSSLPAWLTFNATTRTLSGTPSAANLGTVVVRLTATDSGSLFASTTLTINVKTPATFAFASSTYSVVENEGKVTLTVNRSGDLSAATVNASTSDGTATAGTDYTALSSFALAFAANEATKTLDVSVSNRTGAQGDRTFSVALSAAGDAVLGTPASATVTISDTTTTVTTSVTGGNGGAISGGGSLVVGGSATFTASPATGYRFAGWKVNGTAAGTTNPLVTTVTEGMTVEATFNYQVQILHYYGESGVLGVTTAPILGAMIDRFDDQYSNTVILAEGDTYIPGPWLIAGADPSFNRLLHTGTFTSAADTTATPMGQADIAIMNAFGTTASALGNHEFDLGSPVLSGAFFPANSSTVGNWAGAQFPFITANLDFSADSSLKGRADNSLGGTGGAIAGSDVSALKGKIAPYAIKTINGQKIGFVGATTWDLLTKSSPNGTKPKDDANDATSDLQEAAAYLQGAVNALQALGVNKIVQVDQLDTLQRNKDLAGLVSGIDIMVAGGGHEYQKDSNDVAGSYAGHTTPGSDAYPIQTTGADGKPMLIVTTDTEFSYLGRLVVDFDANGELVLSSLDNTVNGAYSADESTLQAAYGTTNSAATIVAASTIGSTVKTITTALNNVISAKEGTIYGYTNVYLEGDRVFGRTEEVNLGDVTADANAWKARSALGLNDNYAVFSLKNGGGLRASLGSILADGSKVGPLANTLTSKPGNAISLLDVENALRFDNKLMVCDFTPSGLLNVLNFAAGLSSGASQQSGGYPQVGNIRFSYDSSRSTNKVRTVSLVNEAGQTVARIVENGAVLSNAPSVIKAVVLNFTMNGGDGYPIKANASNFRFLLTNGNLSSSVSSSLDFTATATFSSVGLAATDIMGEQKAFQDYLQARYATSGSAFNVADTAVSQDVRVQQLARNGNSDTVNGGSTYTPPTFAFASSTYSVAENAGLVTLTINRSGDLSATTVNVSTTDGTASAGTDYTALSNVAVAFAANQTSKTVDVTVTNRSGLQGDRTFSAALSGNIDIALGSPASATVTINDASTSVTTTVAGNNGGTVSGGGSLVVGSSATFTANPATGYRFAGWKVNGTTAGTTSPLVTTVTEGMTVEATFNYQVQVLHYYGESGLLGTTTAPIMGAMIDRFDDQYANTVILAEGDTFIPGPWLVAGADPSFNSLLHTASQVYTGNNNTLGATGSFNTSATATTAVPMGRADIAIMNAFGTTASALGNHEFDLGSPVAAAAIYPATTTGSSAVGNWVGAQFPFITTNLDFANDSSLRGRADVSLGGVGGTANNAPNVNAITAGTIANLEVSSVNMRAKIAPYAVKTLNGQRIGFVGATTWDLLSKSSPNGTVPKDDNNAATSDLQEAAAYLQGAVNALQALGVNKIIQIDQLDTLQRNKDLAGLVSGIDIMVAGGGHEYQKDANDVAGSYAGHTTPGSDAYPIQTTGADGKPMLIVTTDTEFSYLGRLVVDFDANGELVLSGLDNTVNGAYSADESTLQAAYGTTNSAATIVAASTIGSTVKTITTALNNVISAKEGTIYGYTNVYLEGDRVFGRTQEVNLGDITADANILKARAAYQASGVSTGLNAIFSLKNGGGLRASIGAIAADGSKTTTAAISGIKDAGAISRLDVENALRFDNKIMVFDATPQGLLNILNYAAGLSSGPTVQNGGYPQVGNVRFSYDPSRAAGQKVRNAALYDDNGNLVSVIVQDGAIVTGAPSTIRCVCLNFTANGGDNYPIKYLNPPTNTTVNNETSNFRYVLANGNLSASVTRSLDFTASTTYTSLGLSASDILGEQKAFQDFVVARHGSTSTAYNQADTPASQDLRIQILSSSGRGSNDTVITPAYRFADTAFTATQNDTSVSISINRTYGANAGSVTIRTDNGTTSTVPPFTAAVAGTDYTDADGTVVNFAAGETTKTVSLTLSPKTGATVPNRRFSVVLTASADGVLGTPSTAEVQILAVDTVKPTLTITSPAANAAISDLSPYTIQGIAGDARGIDRVTVALNGAAAVEATLGSATVTTSVPWSIDVAPATDSNSIVVTAYDLSGNSTALTRSFTFTQRTLLTLARTAPSGIALDAAGTVALAASPATNASALTPTTANADPRSAEIVPGTTVTLTATPKTGYAFTSWSGLPSGATALGNVATFTMPSGSVSVSAAFQASTVFAGATGTDDSFFGLILPGTGTATSNSSVAFLSGDLNSGTGTFTGRLLFNGLSYSFTAIVFGDGSVVFGSGATSSSTLTVGSRTLALSYDVSGKNTITGTLTGSGGATSAGTARRAIYSATNLVPSALLNSAVPATGAINRGTFTVAFPAKTQTPALDAATYPQGEGYATLTLSNAGVVTGTGVLADNTAFTVSSALVNGNQCPIFAQLTTPGQAATVRGGSFLGTLVFDTTQSDTDVAGSNLTWIRPDVTSLTPGSTAAAIAAANLYTEGWPSGIVVDANGALYDKAKTVQAAIDLDGPSVGLNGVTLSYEDGKLVLSGGKLTSTITKQNFIVSGNTVTKLPATDTTFSVTLTASTGAFSGSFDPTWTSSADPSFTGILIQKGALKGGHGFFVSNATGDTDPQAGNVNFTLEPFVGAPSPVSSTVPTVVSASNPYSVSGVAGGVRGVSGVEVSVNGSDPVVATLGTPAANGSVSYSASIAPSIGSNVMIVTVTDQRGNRTSTTFNFTFNQRFPLVISRTVPTGISVDTAGTIAMTAVPATKASSLLPTTANANPRSSTVEYGTAVTVTATPKTGYAFVRWTGLPTGSTVTGNIVSFPMPTAAVNLTAEFATASSLFAGATGTGTGFYGLIRPESGTATSNATVGFLSGTLSSSTGVFTGTILVDGVSQAVNATFYGNGTSTFPAGTAKQNSLTFGGRTLSLSLNTDEDKDEISVTLTSAGNTSSGVTKRAIYSATNTAPAALLNATTSGFATLVFPSTTQSSGISTSAYPQGDGFGQIALTSAGLLTIVGTLADNTSFTASTALVEGGEAPFMAQILTPGSTTARGGSFGGTLKFDTTLADSDVTGLNMLWIRPSVTEVSGTTAAALATQLYTAGWPSGIQADALGALYNKALTVQVGLGLGATNPTAGNAKLTFSDGKLTSGIVKTNFNVNGSTVTKIPTTDTSFTLTTTASFGSFTGSIAPNWTPTATALPTFKGIILQKGANQGGFGFFLSNKPSDTDPESGGVSLTKP